MLSRQNGGSNKHGHLFPKPEITRPMTAFGRVNCWRAGRKERSPCLFRCQLALSFARCEVPTLPSTSLSRSTSFGRTTSGSSQQRRNCSHLCFRNCLRARTSWNEASGSDNSGFHLDCTTSSSGFDAQGSVQASDKRKMNSETWNSELAPRNRQHLRVPDDKADPRPQALDTFSGSRDTVSCDAKPVQQPQARRVQWSPSVVCSRMVRVESHSCR